jgi:hypothetical protein
LRLRERIGLFSFFEINFRVIEEGAAAAVRRVGMSLTKVPCVCKAGCDAA